MGSLDSSVPPPPKESFARRNKFVWPLLLTVNLAVGGYILLRTKKKDTSPRNEEANPPSNHATTSSVVSIAAKNPTSHAVAVKTREPIAEKEQRELFKWMLEEKRKAKPKNREDKKQIDEEKAIIKQFIRSKSIPTL